MKLSRQRKPSSSMLATCSAEVPAFLIAGLIYSKFQMPSICCCLRQTYRNLIILPFLLQMRWLVLSSLHSLLSYTLGTQEEPPWSSHSNAQPISTAQSMVWNVNLFPSRAFRIYIPSAFRDVIIKIPIKSDHVQSKERKSRYHTGPGRFSCLCSASVGNGALLATPPSTCTVKAVQDRFTVGSPGCILFFKPLADFKDAGLHDNAFESGEEKKLKTQNFFQFIQNKNTHRIMKI